MILIHICEDGTFETENIYGSAPRAAYHAKKQGADRTIGAEVIAPAFGKVMRDFAHKKLSVGPYLRWQSVNSSIPGWMLWAAKCTTEFGAWFEEIRPEPLDENKDRILGHIDRRTKVSLGILVNLCRPLPESYINELLEMLIEERKIKKRAGETGQKAVFYSTY